MGEKTGIPWCHHTFNPWWGCLKVAPGCDHCYAADLDKRTGGDHWRSAPRVMSIQNWNTPLRWNKAALAAGERRRVFCGSMCDWTDNRAPEGQLARLWDLIRATPGLDWLLLTKRARISSNRCRPIGATAMPMYGWGVTVENREQGLPRLERLRTIPAKVRFLSIEPLLEDLGELDLTGIHWVIVGGESGPHARPMDPEWALSILRQCRVQGVPVFHKQWGGRTADKGGCLVHGAEIKEFPLVTA